MNKPILAAAVGAALILPIFAFGTFKETTSDLSMASGGPPPMTVADLQHKGTLVVGADIPYGVMEFYDDSGDLAGIDMDIARELATQLGVSLEVKNIPFNQLFEKLESGSIDLVISAVTITPERQQQMLFSAPYLDAGMSIAVHEDNTEIRRLKDLRGKRVGVLKGTIGEELISKSEYVDQSLVQRFEKNDERVQALVDGKVDAIVVHFLVKDIPSVKIVGEPLSQSYYGVVTRLNNRELMLEINRVLRGMKRSGALQEIKRRYVGS